MTKRVLLTGATGYVGRHVLSALLDDGCDVTAVVRRRGGRLAERLGRREPGAAGTLRVVEGDTARAGLGLGWALPPGIFDAFVHCAGLTEFDEGAAAELRRQNRDGTRNAHALCVELKIPQFHHVSTAFVAGDVPGPFGPQDPPAAALFKNPYERSKAEAERLLRETTCGPVIVTVYRPGIVVGGRVLGEDGSAGTLYAYLKALWFIRECVFRDGAKSGRLAARHGVSRDGGVWSIPMRIEAEGAMRIQVTPVTDLASRIAVAVRRPPGSCGTHHLLSSSSFTAEQLKETFCAALGIRGVRLVRPGELGEATALEKKFSRMTRAFRPYLSGMPEFTAQEWMPAVPAASIARDFAAELDAAARGRNPLGAVATDCIGASRPDRYLDAFAGGDVGSSLLRRIPFVDATVRFRVRGRSETTRTLAFANGTVRAVPADGPADFTYDMDETVFRQVVGGELDPREAFFAGRLAIEGDQEKALKFGYPFTEHFGDIDNRILEELE